MAKQRGARPKTKTNRSLKKPKLKAARRKRADRAPAVESVLDTRRTDYLEAIRSYERALQALRQRDFQTAAEAFKAVLNQHPEERELHERARLYLKVCERETGPPPPVPQTSEELVYAATLALNAGALAEAARHLHGAIEQSSDDDQAHYMLAVVYAHQAQTELALTHLRRAVDLAPENRALARQQPDFETIRTQGGFRQILEPPMTAPPRRRPRRPLR